MSNREVTILHVEDDELDVMGLERAFKAEKISNPILVAHDGVEGFEFLRGMNGGEPLPRPYMILLDLNMPRMDGITFLRELRADPKLRDTVVFVMTTSKADEDRMKAYDFNVAGYILKDDPARSFLDATHMLEAYWKVVELPN